MAYMKGTKLIRLQLTKVKSMQFAGPLGSVMIFFEFRNCLNSTINEKSEFQFWPEAIMIEKGVKYEVGCQKL